MRLTVATLWLAALGASVLPAQEPNFRPVRPAPQARPAQPEEAPAPKVVKPDPEALDPIDAQFQALAAWPAQSARSAALVLAGLGAEVRDRLIGNLTALDWRVQAASAFALSQMGSKEALAPLGVAVRNDANRMAAPELMRSLVAIEPLAGSRAIFPLLWHKTGRLRVAARRALPAVIDASFLPEILRLLADRKAQLRSSGLELLGRVPNTADRREWVDALSDPKARVAMIAARHLGEEASEDRLRGLCQVVADGPSRAAAYAMLALVIAEDRRGLALTPVAGGARERAISFLGGQDPFYQGASASLLANLSFRSTDPDLHEIADRKLVPALLTAVASGVFYTDYSSVADLCWEKLKMLSGEDFGADAPRWIGWWQENAADFKARRRLSHITQAELESAWFVYARSDLRGVTRVISLAGDRVPQGSKGSTLILDATSRAELFQALNDADFFAGPSEQGEDNPLLARHELRLRKEPEGLEHRRVIQGDLDGKLAKLVATIEGLQRHLAWQVLVPAIDDPNFDRAEAEEFFRTATNPVLRSARESDLVLKAYPALDAEQRAIAASSLERTTPDWRKVHARALAGLLGSETELTPAAATLIGLLHGSNAPLVVDAVSQHLSEALSPQRAAVLEAWLAAANRASTEALTAAPRAWMRSLAYGALVAHVRRDEEPATPFIEGLSDADPEVRRACIAALAALGSEAALPVLINVIEDGEPALRLRAIEALAVVGGAQSVPRLRDLTRSEDRRDRWVAVRALGQAGGMEAIIALAAVVRETGAPEIKREAIEALLTIEHPEMEARLLDLLQRVTSTPIRVDLVRAVARQFGPRALATLKPLHDDADTEVARTATLEAARLGDATTRTRLLSWMQAIEGDRAAERALEELTFFTADDPSPPRRYEAHKQFGERFGAFPRKDWFLKAVRAHELILDPEVDWFGAEVLDSARARALLTVLRKGDRALTLAADRILLRVSKLPLEPLDDQPAQFSVQQRAETYATWITNSLVPRERGAGVR